MMIGIEPLSSLSLRCLLPYSLFLPLPFLLHRTCSQTYQHKTSLIRQSSSCSKLSTMVSGTSKNAFSSLNIPSSSQSVNVSKASKTSTQSESQLPSTGASPTTPSATSMPSTSAMPASRSHVAQAASAIHDTTAQYLAQMKATLVTNYWRTIALLVTIVGIGLTATLVYKEELRRSAATEVASVARQSLRSSEVTTQVRMLTSDTVARLLADERLRIQATEFIQELLKTPSVMRSVSELAEHTIQKQNVQDQAVALGKTAVLRLTEDKQITQALEQLARDTIKSLSNDPEVKALLVSMLHNTLDEEAAKAVLSSSAKETAARTFRDDEFRTNAVEAMKRILDDRELQIKGGDAAWQTVKYAVLPKSWTHSSHDLHDDMHSSSSPVSLISDTSTTQSLASTIPIHSQHLSTIDSNDAANSSI